MRSWRSLKNIFLYSTEHRFTTALTIPPPAVTTIVNSSIWAGLVGMIDAQVRQLRETPGFNQTHAEQLGIIPRAPSNPNLDTLTGNLRARNFRGVRTATVQVDRGDGAGWQHLTSSRNDGSFVDNHPQPERPCTWVYRQFYIDENGNQIGLVSHASIIAVAQT